MKRKTLALLLIAAFLMGAIVPTILATASTGLFPVEAGTSALSRVLQTVTTTVEDAAGEESDAEAETADSRGAVVYIPLDDRPFNEERVELIAASMDVELIMPDADLYSTKLDGQSTNECGLQYGNRGALVAWLMEQAETCDTFIISLDQLLSGGLMNSRCMAEMKDLVLPDGTTMTEYEVIDYLQELAETKEVYIIDSVLRLASSSGYGGYSLQEYGATMRYGKLARPVLTGQQLTVENIIENYPLTEDGTSAAEDAALGEAAQELLLGEPAETAILSREEAQAMGLNESDSPDSVQESESSDPAVSAEPEASAATSQEVAESPSPSPAQVEEPIESTKTDDETLVERYLQIRERKLRLTDYALRHLIASEHVHYLLGVDDSAAGNTIQSNEMAYYSRFLSGDDQMFAALDGLGQFAVTSVYRDMHGSGEVTVNVRYYGEVQSVVMDYNYKSVGEIVEQTVSYLGGTVTEADADVQLLVVSSNFSSAEERISAFTQVINQLSENEAAGIPTMLADLTTTDRGVFRNMLIESANLGYLFSYSGANELPVQVTMAVSQGLGRYYALHTSLSDAAQSSHIENLTQAFVKEIYKAGEPYQEICAYLSDNDIYSGNFGALTQEQEDAVQGELYQLMQEATQGLLQNISSSNFIASLSPYTEAGISAVTLEDCVFPWLRTFEIDCTVSCTISETVNETSYHPAYIQGITETQFAPDENLTRSQAAKLIVAISQTPLESAELCPFDDVPEWARAYVATAYVHGYMKGYPDGSFHGDSSITRAELVSVAVNYLSAENRSLSAVKTAAFTDVARQGSAWYAKNVYTLADAGIISGYRDGSFRPENPITRAETVAILSRLFGRGEALSDRIMEVQRFSDVPKTHWAYQVIQEASFSHYDLQ